MGVAAIDDENLMVVDRRDIIEIKSMLIIDKQSFYFFKKQVFSKNNDINEPFGSKAFCSEPCIFFKNRKYCQNQQYFNNIYCTLFAHIFYFVFLVFSKSETTQKINYCSSSISLKGGRR